VKKKLNRENVHSRAYIAFKTEELVAKFSREYDGHVFKDKAGLCLPVSMLVACDGRDSFPHPKGTNRWPWSSLHPIRSYLWTRKRSTVGMLQSIKACCHCHSSAPLSPDHPIQTRNTSLFYSPSKPLQPSFTMQTNSWRC